MKLEEVQRRIDRLEADNRTLKEKVEELTRGGKRQAKLFLRWEPKEEPKEEPKKPGQKAGHAARHRAAPDKIDRVLKVRTSIQPGPGAERAAVATTRRNEAWFAAKLRCAARCVRRMPT